MKLTLFTLLVLAVAVVVRSQQQGAKPEPVPHSEQHSPGNPPPQPNAPPPNGNSTNVGGNTITNQAVPKPENSPKAEPPSTGETKPKSEPTADHDHDHDNEHDHSPGNPKHLDHMGGGVEGVRGAQLLLAITAVAPFLLTMLAL